jgi:hypothetical protein
VVEEVGSPVVEVVEAAAVVGDVGVTNSTFDGRTEIRY